MHTPSLKSFSLPSNELQDPHPEVELAPPLRAIPLSEPRLISPASSSIQDEEQRVQSRPTTGNASVRAKRESYNLSGSTFLITSNGRTLKLPVPSSSKADPLNWSLWKTAGAIFAIVLYSVVCLTAVQGVSVVFNGIQEEFQHEVCLTLFLLGDGWLAANIAYTVIPEYCTMENKSACHRTYPIHGTRMLPMGATVDRSRTATDYLGRYFCRPTRSPLGWRGNLV
jgi:hypothetical protein